jgi:hypothetical protein
MAENSCLTSEFEVLTTAVKILMFFQDVTPCGIYLQVHAASQSRRTKAILSLRSSVF